MSDPKKLKVFICYAQNDKSLFNEFLKQFEYHNGDYSELLHDGVPFSGNMHERFKNFAETCHIALLLTSAKFTLSSSYASEHEVPILLNRALTKDVVVIGVRFQYVDLSEWNKRGDVYFFPLTNVELPNFYREKENQTTHNDSYAVYGSIPEKDHDFFHVELKKWIQKVYESFENEKTTNKSTTEVSNQGKEKAEDSNWSRMLNPDFFHLEQKLRDMEETYFQKNGFPKPDSNIPYIQAYFTLSEAVLKKVELELTTCDPNNYRFVQQVIELCKKPIVICKQLKALLDPTIPSYSGLSWAVDDVCLRFDNLEGQLLKLMSKNTSPGCKALKNEHLIPLSRALKKLIQEVNEFIEEKIQTSQN